MDSNEHWTWSPKSWSRGTALLPAGCTHHGPMASAAAVKWEPPPTPWGPGGSGALGERRFQSLPGQMWVEEEREGPE